MALAISYTKAGPRDSINTISHQDLEAFRFAFYNQGTSKNSSFPGVVDLESG